MWYADSYGLIETAGTDRHEMQTKAKCAVVFDEKLQTIDDYIRLVKADRIAELICER